MTKHIENKHNVLSVMFDNGDNIQFNVMPDGTAHCDNFKTQNVFVEAHNVLLAKFAITQFNRVLEACEQAGGVVGVCNRLGILYRESIQYAK